MKKVAGLLVCMVVGLAWAAGAAPATKYYGAIDLGSKGTKAALYSFVKEAEGRDAHVLFNKVINTSLVSGMNGARFAPQGIQEASDAVKQLLADMKAEAAKRNLADVEYYVVGSSGVAMAENKGELAAAVNAATGSTMTFVDTKQEAYFAAVSAIPRVRRVSSIVVDIGSGNTKVGCFVGDTDFKSAAIPYGSVSGRNAGAKQNSKDIPAGIKEVITNEVVPSYKTQSMNVPCVANRQRIYWIGGAAWATATFTHPEGAQRGFVVVHRKDLDTFLTHLADGTWNQNKVALSLPKDMPAAEQKAIREKAEKDRDDVLNVFVREDLFSGVSIMKAVLDSSNPSAVIVFNRDANYIYGYALEKYKEDQETGAAAAGR